MIWCFTRTRQSGLSWQMPSFLRWQQTIAPIDAVNHLYKRRSKTSKKAKIYYAILQRLQNLTQSYKDSKISKIDSVSEENSSLHINRTTKVISPLLF